jgi:tetratricopeptide (TPR) repeat protein
LGGVLQRLGKFPEAADALERSKTISEQMGDERSLAMVLNSLGGVLQRLGKFPDAADALQRSHDLLKAQGDRRGQAMVLNSLGGALQRLGRIGEADQAFMASISFGEELKDNSHLAKVQTAYGKALVSCGDAAAGIDLQQGFVLDEQKKNRRGLAIVAPVLINALWDQGRSDEASDFLARALAIAPHERAIQQLSTRTPLNCVPMVQISGRIKRLLEPLGRAQFGFFRADVDGTDVYFSERQIGSDVFSRLSVGMLVEADVITARDGRRQALAIRKRSDLDPDSN